MTDHKRPVAEILPIDMTGLAPRDRLARLAASGETSTPIGRGLVAVRPTRIRGRPISETLVEDRR